MTAHLAELEDRLRSAQMGHSYEARTFLKDDAPGILSELNAWRQAAVTLRAAKKPVSMPLEFAHALDRLEGLITDVETAVGEVIPTAVPHA